MMPELVGTDPGNRVLVLEDLGEASDFTSLYAEETLDSADAAALVDFLLALHRTGVAPAHRAVFANRDMRALNHEHIFQLPLTLEPGLDLDAVTPGLGEASRPLKEDTVYVSRVHALGALYLADGSQLVHGDYFPGSWLRTPRGLRVIDHEFCFIGEPAFDLGVMLGHLHLAAQPDALGDEVLSRYGADARTAALARGFAGVEIMRRLIGVAQLPLDAGLERKVELLALSRRLVLDA